MSLVEIKSSRVSGFFLKIDIFYLIFFYSLLIFEELDKGVF